MATEINIGENVKKHRTKQGLSQEDFAKKSGVKYTTLTKIESNVIKKPSVLIMAKLAKALGVNIEDLIKKIYGYRKNNKREFSYRFRSQSY